MDQIVDTTTTPSSSGLTIVSQRARDVSTGNAAALEFVEPLPVVAADAGAACHNSWSVTRAASHPAYPSVAKD